MVYIKHFRVVRDKGQIKRLEMAMDVISRKLTVYTKTDELMVLVPSTTISVIHVYIFNSCSARTSYIFFQAYTMPLEF